MFTITSIVIVTLIKNVGKSTFIFTDFLHFILPFTGFPESAINKVESKLESEKISYSVYEKDNLLEEYKGIDKNYKIVLSKALKNYDIEKRLTRLKSKINNLTIEELERVIDSLEAKSI